MRFNVIVPYNGNCLSVSNGILFSSIGIICALYIACYILRSLGLYTMAKKGNIENAGVSWVPFAWIYIAYKLLGETKVFGKDAKKIALLICVLYTSIQVISLVYNILTYLPLVGYYLQGGEVYYAGAYSITSGSIIEYAYDAQFYVGNNFVNPYVGAMKSIIDILYYMNVIISLVVIIIDVTTYFALFRRYWPQHYTMASLFSVFFSFTFGIFVFVIRNKEPIDFREYLRNRYMGYYNHGNEPPYWANQNRNQKSDSNQPFGEYENKKPNDDPFSEFPDNKDN